MAAGVAHGLGKSICGRLSGTAIDRLSVLDGSCHTGATLSRTNIDDFPIGIGLLAGLR